MARMPSIHSRRGVPMGGEDGQVLVMDEGRVEWAEPESLSGGQAGIVLGGKLIGANMNSTADQAIPIVSPTTNYKVFQIHVANPSISMTTAAGGVYLEAAKAKPIVASAQAYSLLTTNVIDTSGNTTALTIQTQYVTDNPTIYLSLTTPQGAPATLDFYVFIFPLQGA